MALFGLGSLWIMFAINNPEPRAFKTNKQHPLLDAACQAYFCPGVAMYKLHWHEQWSITSAWNSSASHIVFLNPEPSC